MQDRSRDIRLFERAAQQRLRAAWFLFHDEGKRFNLDAMYLGGYAVECSLKAMILKRTATNQHRQVMEALTEVGALAHDFEYLKGILKERTVGRSARDREILGMITRSMKKVSDWTTELRYQARLVKSKEAESFLQAAQNIVDYTLRG